MDDLLEKKLQAKGAVLIEGPKWCGKTTTAEEFAASKVMLARTDVKNNFKSLLEIDTDAARMKSPAFQMILTATGEYAYRRPTDGIYIVPIGCLKQ